MVRTEYFDLQGKNIQFAFHLQSGNWICILDEQTMQQMREFKPPLLDRNVDELELSVRASNCLKAEGIYKIRQLVAHTPNELFKLPNFGRTSLREVELALQKVGLGLAIKVKS